MTQKHINLGNYPNDPSADTMYVAFPKVEANFDDLYQGAAISNATLALATATGSTTARTLGSRFADWVNVKDFGATGNGTTDDTAAIQAAAAAISSTGGTLFIPAGTYLISGTTSLKSNTAVVAEMGATLLASSGWPNADASGAADLSAGNAFFQNVNYTASVLTDNNISISGLTFNYGSYITASSHAIGFRMATHIQILNCRFVNGANGTAMKACYDVVTEGCIATGQQNCCYDHWESTSNVRVAGCHAEMSSVSGTGIQVSGLGTTGAAGNSSLVAIVGNTVVGNTNAGVGITLNALSSSSSSSYGAISGNILSNAGIILDGPGNGHTVSANVLVGANCVIWLRSSGGAITNCSINGNVIANASVLAGNVAPIQLNGSGHICNSNRIAGGSWDTGIWIPGNNCALTGNLIDSVTGPSGPSSYYNPSGSNNVIVDSSAAGVVNFVRGAIAGQYFSAGGTSALSSDANGNLTVPSLQVSGGASPIYISVGVGVPTSGAAGASISGSLRIRSDGAVGSRIYVSQGGGTWLPIGGV